MNRPLRASSIGSTDTPSSIRGCASGLPSSSTFQGAKWLSGVKGVPYFASMPSVASVSMGAEAEHHREFAQVRLQLRMRRGDAGGCRAGTLQLDDDERHPVDEQHDVESAVEVTAPERQLVDGEPVIVGRVGAEQSESRILFDTVGVDVAQRISADEVLVDAMVLGDRVLRLRRGDLRDRLLEILAGHGGVESAQRVEQTRTDQQVVPRVALTAPGCDLLAVGRGRQPSGSASVSRASFSQSASDSAVMVCRPP